VVPAGHALTACPDLTLDDLLEFPLITSDNLFADDAQVNQALARRQAAIALRSVDADIVKTYVELGLGVGIMMDIAFDAQRDRDLHALPVDHLFGSCTARVAFRRGRVMRGYVYTLAEIISPFLGRERVELAMGQTAIEPRQHVAASLAAKESRLLAGAPIWDSNKKSLSLDAA